MNSSDNNLKIGVATSRPQQERPLNYDHEFIQKIHSVIDSQWLDKEEALNIIVNSHFEQFQTPLSEIGLNLQTIKNVIQDKVNAKEFDKAFDIVKSIADIVVFGLDNEEVFDKYISLLNLFGLEFFRFSLGWDKILNDDLSVNEEGIDFYVNQCFKLTSNNIQPIVTFTHFETRGMDINSKQFEAVFSELSSKVLEKLIPAGVNYWIPFNEPAVHSGGVNLGFWGKGGRGLINLINHFRTLKTIGNLSKQFYTIVQKVNLNYQVNSKVIGSFNVALFDGGESPTAPDKFLIWLGNIIDKNAQINPFRFKDGTWAFDIIAFQPYQIYNFALVNRLIRAKLPNIVKGILTADFLSGNGIFNPDEIELDSIIPDLSNPDFKNPDEVRYGGKGEILYPKAIRKVIHQIRNEFHFDHFVVTEMGANIDQSTLVGQETSEWYLTNVMKQLNQLIAEGISIPFALIWTLINMFEIAGPHGGGIKNWNYGIFGKPLHENEIKEILQRDFKLVELQAGVIAKKIVLEGNTPVQIFGGAVKKLSKIFNNPEVNPMQLLDALGGKLDEKNRMIYIMQLMQIRNYYNGQKDEDVVYKLNLILDELMVKYVDDEITQNVKAVEA